MHGHTNIDKLTQNVFLCRLLKSTIDLSHLLSHIISQSDVEYKNTVNKIVIISKLGFTHGLFYNQSQETNSNTKFGLPLLQKALWQGIDQTRRMP